MFCSKMLLFSYLFLNVYVSIAFCDSNVSNLIHRLITSSERWFSKDADAISPNDFTIFLQKDNSSLGDTNAETIYINEDHPEITLRNKHFDNGDPLIILKKGEDGLHPNNKFTYVVLRQVVTSPKLYSAHLAYIREIDGKDDIEWDNYNPSIKRENVNFVATFDPYGSKVESVVRTINVTSGKQNNGSLANTDLSPFTFLKNKSKTETTMTTPATDTENSPFFSHFEESLLQEAEIFRSLNTTPRSSPISDNLETGAVTATSPNFDIKTSPFFSHLEESLLQESEIFQSSTTTPRSSPIPENLEVVLSDMDNYDDDNMTHSTNNETTTSKSVSDLRIKFKCPPNSGAILLGRNCFCPEGTMKLEEKCVEQSKELPENVTSEEDEKSIQIRLKNNNHGLVNVHIHCPKDSGSVLVGRKCFCPDGSHLKNKKCVQHNNKISRGDKMSVDIQENSPRVVRNVMTSKNLATAQRIGGMTVAKTPAPVVPRGRVFVTRSPRILTAGDNTMELARSFFNIRRKGTPMLAGDQSLKLSNALGNGIQYPKNFEDTTPFTGILTCPYERPNENSMASKANTLDNIGAIVDFYLSSLRAQCHPEIRVNTIRLFEKRLVTVGNNSRVKLNSDHELLKKRVFSVPQWNDVISGIFLSLYSEAYRDQMEKSNDKISNTTAPDGKGISHSVFTLTLMVDEAMKLLKKEMKYHAVKFNYALTSAVNERLLKVFREKEQLLFDCYDCDKEQVILNQNEVQLRALLDFIRYSFVNVITPGGQKTFLEYYHSTTQPSVKTLKTSSGNGGAVDRERSSRKPKGSKYPDFRDEESYMFVPRHFRKYPFNKNPTGYKSPSSRRRGFHHG